MRWKYLIAAVIFGVWLTSLVAGSPNANAAPILVDGSFESPALASGAYQYGGGCPTPPCSSTSIAGYGWTFAPASSQSPAAGSGIINATSSNAWWPSPTFSTPTGFDGNQYAFVQGKAAMSQTFIAPSSGHFDVTWLEGSRPNIFGLEDGNQTYQVSINSSIIGTYSTLSGQNFELETSTIFSLTAGDPYTLTFQGLTTNNDSTVFLDSVSINLEAAIPESSTWAMMLLGFAVLGLVAYRRKSKPAVIAV